MKVVAVIPIKGRLPLLKFTIQRLLNKNGLTEVICVGSKDEQKTVENAGAVFLEYNNTPLGDKWNHGFEYARRYNPDAVLFVGSSDWLSDNWLSETTPYLKDYDLIGKKDFYMMDFQKQIRSCHWLGYVCKRKDEAIGIGRLISRNILDKMEWKPFLDHANNSMDFAMYNKALSLGGKYKVIENDNLVSLSISCDKWENMHRFEDHYSNKIPSIKVDNQKLINLFPEALEFHAVLQK
jgi:glycosyltransferase involved in cell wall biosynthesis